MSAPVSAPVSASVLAQHMGGLHAYEQVLVYLLAFGPFVVLGIVVYVVRRRDVAAEDRTAGDPIAEDPIAEDPIAEEPTGDLPGRTRG